MKNRVPYKRRPSLESALEKTSTFLGPKTLKKLQAIAIDRDLPVARLIAYAIDNEFDVQPPFDFNYEIPTHPPYVEFQYAKQAQKVLSYLHNFPIGTGIDMLVLCRREYDIESPQEVLFAIRELLEKQMVISFYPTKSIHRFAKDYKYLKVHPDFARHERDQKYRPLKSTYVEEKGPLAHVESDPAEE